MRRFVMPWTVRGPARAFHVTADARERVGVEAAWVTLRGDVLLADPRRAALVAERVAATAVPGDPPLRAADLYAGALLEEVYHLVITRYLEVVDPRALDDAERRARGWLGDGVDATLRAFVRRYPPPDVAAGAAPDEALARRVEGVSGRQVALEEAWTCFLANANPALRGARSLVDVRPLAATVPYDALIDALRGHFADRPGLPGRRRTSLFELLLEPARAHPDDLSAQLRFVRDQWGALLGDAFRALLDRLLDAIAAVREADVARGGPPGPPPPPSRWALRGAGGESERFSPDGAWMPQVVMVAKSTYVWLDQLSREHGVAVDRLDQVPEQELARLAGRGFNALWLIGLWQRSEASRTIKRLRGQHDALASAYALHDYAIAHDLGGEAAYADLKARAARHGIRMATDMVPNHVGIDGRWVVEHPERFVQLDHPPYPGYRFTGTDLSPDPRVEIRIEDHYYDGSDAAVVFERRDRATGEVRYLYHGNDGTAMPWNDTAQLDYLRADVREAVIRTILDVARRSPIIRFDAAMTLAKRHVRRLWYPPPGEGGGVPSRGRYGALTDEDFERAMPVEFWREVVDRVAAEVPDTLLLAEAFWMMEGFFVRTLGMHRVYNSAFMHMMRQQDNGAYRAILREVLAFDPRILQRYVNFMNNPDEETARVQFGDGDRYFAVATLLATMPGLPMFGHGQFEGFREKYGMEFRRAKWDEHPDEMLLERHERELVPVLRRRWQFAAVDAFRLFDLVDDQGAVNDDVYAYANRVGGAASLVLVNHRYPRSSGRLRHSVPQVGEPGGPVRSDDVAAALGLAGGPGRFVIARDLVRGVEYVRRSDDVRRDGWRVALDGYETRVLVDVREVTDADGALAELAARLGDRGVVSLQDALDDLRHAPIHEAFALAVGAWRTASRWVEAWEGLLGAAGLGAAPAPPAARAASEARLAGVADPGVLAASAAVVVAAHLPAARDTWRRARLARAVASWLAGEGVPDAAGLAATADAALATLPSAHEPWPGDGAWAEALRGSPEAVAALGVHEYGGTRWLRREAAVRWLDVVWLAGRRQRPGAGPARALAAWRERWLASLAASGYRWDAWLEAAVVAAAPTSARRAAAKDDGTPGRTMSSAPAPKAPRERSTTANASERARRARRRPRRG